MQSRTINADEHIQAALREAGAPSSSPLMTTTLGNPFQTPPEPMMMSIDVREIRTRVINPRVAENERRDYIRSSLRTHGFTQTLEVTRRPGDDYYIATGGDTRIEEAQRLCKETGDDRFCRPTFHFVPWSNESTVMAKALADNLARSDMTWWDTAAAIIRHKNFLETDRGETLSLRQLATELKTTGIPVGKSTAALYAFAVEKLNNLSETARQALTKEAATTLQPIIKALEQILLLAERPLTLLQAPIEAHSVNDKDFAVQRLVDALHVHLANELEQSTSLVAAAAQHVQQGGKPATFDELLTAATRVSAARTLAQDSASETSAATPHSAGEVSAPRTPTAGHTPTPTPNTPTAPTSPRAAADTTIGGELEQDRSTAMELAQSIADLYQLPIIEINAGYGFTLDQPDPALEPHDIHRISSFWLLLTISESTASQRRVELCASSGSTLMVNIMRGEVPGIVEPTWAQIGYTTLLSGAFSPFEEFIQLLSHCRRMRQHYANLWEEDGL